MDSHQVALLLPPEIKKKIASLCFGLPNAQWIDAENFCIMIRDLGPIDAATKLDIDEDLTKISLPPFDVSLKGIGCSHQKNQEGNLWVIVEPSEPLSKLKHAIDKVCQPYRLGRNGKGKLNPHIPLAFYKNVVPERIAMYLEANGAFSIPSFKVERFSLLSCHITKKRLLMVEEASYQLGK